MILSSFRPTFSFRGDTIDSTWYRKWFCEEYALAYAHRGEEEALRQVDFAVRRLGLTDGARVLDLCCGAGRHSEILCRRGFEVSGVDLSEDLILMASKRTGRARLARADMRRVPFAGGFDAVLSFFTSFGYFEKDGENAAVLDEVSRLLRPGGKFLLDYLNPAHVIKSLEPEGERKCGGLVFKERRRIDENRGRVEKTITLEKNGVVKRFEESVRLFSPDEIRGMMVAAGLKVLAVYGDFDSSEFNDDSPRMIVLAEKRSDL